MIFNLLGNSTSKCTIAIYLASAGQNQVDHPESVSHEIQYKVPVYTEIFVGSGKFDNVFDTRTG